MSDPDGLANVIAQVGRDALHELAASHTRGLDSRQQ
jgi:hypothetical protein